jgi:inner membrane protein
MDNITHSLAGYLIAKTAASQNPKKQEAIVWTTLIGSNLPDIDFAVQLVDPSNKLQYLLHHRGYTHSIIFAVPLGFIASWAATKITGIGSLPTRRLFLLGVVSVVLHILADYFNNYGVHPFSPFFNKWYYGDSIFIIEPLIWLCCLPLIFLTVKNSLIKAGSLLLEVSILALVWLRLFNSTAVAVILTIWAGLFLGIQSKWKSVIPAVTGMALTLLVFWIGSFQAKAYLISVLKQIRGVSIEPQQLSVSPSPSNPFCWSFVFTHINTNKEYTAKVGVVSLWPSVFSPSACHFRTGIGSKNLVATSHIAAPVSDHIYWIGEMVKPVTEYYELKNQYCQFNQFSKFSRAPAWFKKDGRWFVTDLRFDGTGRNGFFTFQLNQDAPCNYSFAPWSAPVEQVF